MLNAKSITPVDELITRPEELLKVPPEGENDAGVNIPVLQTE